MLELPSGISLFSSSKHTLRFIPNAYVDVLDFAGPPAVSRELILMRRESLPFIGANFWQAYPCLTVLILRAGYRYNAKTCTAAPRLCWNCYLTLRADGRLRQGPAIRFTLYGTGTVG